MPSWSRCCTTSLKKGKDAARAHETEERALLARGGGGSFLEKQRKTPGVPLVAPPLAEVGLYSEQSHTLTDAWQASKQAVAKMGDSWDLPSSDWGAGGSAGGWGDASSVPDEGWGASSAGANDWVILCSLTARVPPPRLE